MSLAGFLIKNRLYCELCSGFSPATQMVKIKFRDTVVCDAHYRAYTPPQPNQNQERKNNEQE